MLRVLVLGLLALHSVFGRRCIFSKTLKTGEVFELTRSDFKIDVARGLNCYWTITTLTGNQMVIRCPNFIITAPAACAKDFFTLNMLRRLKYCPSRELYSNSPWNTFIATLNTTANARRLLCPAPSVTPAPGTCQCGMRNTFQGRIVNGVEAVVHEFPYQAYIRIGSQSRPSCSATIISPEYVMTAAHCVAGFSPERIKVVVGDHDTVLQYETDRTVVHEVLQIKQHENYNSTTNKNDIALIRLSKPIEYNQDVGPVCLPFKLQGQNFANKSVTLAGWGTSDFGGLQNSKLTKVIVQVSTDAVCNRDHPTADSTNLCTLGIGKGTCQYDSGGSIFYNENGRDYSIGVIIGQNSCGNDNSELATRVTPFLPWIMTNAVGQTFCNQ